MTNINEYLKNFDFFKNMNFDVYDLQPLNKPYKVFRVEDLALFKQYKVRVNTPVFPHGIDRELNIINILASLPQKYHWMPQIVYIDEGRNILVIDYIEGDILSNQLDSLTNDEKDKIKKDAFSILKELHSLPIPKYMNLETKKTIDNWYVYMKRRFMSDLERTKAALNPEQKKYILAILENYQDYLSNAKLSFLHGDLKPSNMIYNPQNKLFSLIDFESCKIGDAFYDISRMAFDCPVFYDEALEENEIYQLYKLDTFLHWLANTVHENKEVQSRTLQGIEGCLRYFQNLKR